MTNKKEIKILLEKLIFCIRKNERSSVEAECDRFIKESREIRKKIIEASCQSTYND